MDVINYKPDSKNIGKRKCRCGLVVRLYEDDIVGGTWKCPNCNSTNNYQEDDNSFKIIFVIEVIVALVLFLWCITSDVQDRMRTNKMKAEYKYSFETPVAAGDRAWRTMYTDDDRIIDTHNIVMGIEFYDINEVKHFTESGQPVRNVVEN